MLIGRALESRAEVIHVPDDHREGIGAKLRGHVRVHVPESVGKDRGGQPVACVAIDEVGLVEVPQGLAASRGPCPSSRAPLSDRYLAVPSDTGGHVPLGRTSSTSAL